jgi:hypothetical protein
MVVASLVVSAVAVLVAIASMVYARQNAVAANRSAKAAEDSAQAAEDSAQAGKDSLEIETARRLEERRPRLSGRIEHASGGYELWVTLQSDERLESVELSISRGQGVSFVPNADGVDTPPGADAAWCASSYLGDSPDGMEPRESMTWPVEVKRGLNDRTVQIEATCYGAHGEMWESVLVEAPIEPSRTT